MASDLNKGGEMISEDAALIFAYMEFGHQSQVFRAEWSLSF